MMFLFFRACALLSVCYITVASVRHQQSETGKSEQDMKVYPVENRLKRSPILKGVGAMVALLRKAKFLYSNGLHKVFTRKGGVKTALSDFDKVSRPTSVRTIETNLRDGQIRKTGQVGRWSILVNADTKRGSATIQISKPFKYHSVSTVIDPKTIDTIIVYGD